MMQPYQSLTMTWGEVGKGGSFSDGFGVWLQGLPRAGDGVLEKSNPGESEEIEG